MSEWGLARIVSPRAGVVAMTLSTQEVWRTWAGKDGGQLRSLVPPHRLFPELITEQAEPGEEQVYGAATELVVDWREAWAARKQAPFTLDWLRAERRRWSWSFGWSVRIWIPSSSTPRISRSTPTVGALGEKRGVSRSAARAADGRPSGMSSSPVSAQD